MPERQLSIHLAFVAGLAILVGGPATALQFQVMGGPPEYFRTGDSGPVAPQRPEAKPQSRADAAGGAGGPSSAFSNGYRRTAGGVTFEPPMAFFPAGSSDQPPEALPIEIGPGTPEEVLLSALPEPEVPPSASFAPASAGPVQPLLSPDVAAPVPLPPALPLFAAVIAGLAFLPARRRA